MSALRRLVPLALLVGSTLLALLLGEGAARLAVNPADFLHAKLIEDPALSHRIEPLTTGHDALGFRNRQVPASAAIVAIGDSMTYGVGASREAAWPAQLGELLGEQVYNMGLGGYGPLQYLHLAQGTAQTLRPRLLVVAVYLGNDMMDSFSLARSRPYWHPWRVSVEVEPALTDYDRAGQAEPRKRFAALRDWLARNSVIYSMLRATVLQRVQASEQDAMAARSDPDVRLLWQDAANPGLRTIFTPALRLAAVDLDIKSVREGMEISQKALAALKGETDKRGVALLVVLIPTKERVYCGPLGRSGFKPPASFSGLCDAEARASAEWTRFLDARGIAHVDVRPALEARIDARIPVYPSDSDGHPQATGYKVIAEEVAAAVRRHYPGKPSR